MVSVVQRLKPLGYRVALAGKRHIGPESVFPFEYLDGDTGDGDGPGPDFAAVDAFLGDATGKQQPFCLFLASHLPHSAWTKGDQTAIDANAITLPPHYVDNAATRRNYRDYLAEVHELDSQLKGALALLDKHGLSDSTVVVFTSEQGTSMPFAKWTCYNAGLGSALIVRWPGKVVPGAVSEAMGNELTAFERMDKAPFNGDGVTVLRTVSPSTPLRKVSPGVRYSLYNGDWSALPDFAGLTLARTGTTPDFTSTGSLPGKSGPRYAVRYPAFVQAKVGGFHTFYLDSTHPARILIDGKFVVGKEGISARRSMPRRYGCIPLDSGRHAIEVDFLGGSANDSLSVGWSYPGLIEAVGNLQIPAGALVSGDPVVALSGPRGGAGDGKLRMQGRDLLVPASLLGVEIRVVDLRGRVHSRSRGSERLALTDLPIGAYSVQAWGQGRCLVSQGLFKH